MSNQAPEKIAARDLKPGVKVHYSQCIALITRVEPREGRIAVYGRYTHAGAHLPEHHFGTVKPDLLFTKSNDLFTLAHLTTLREEYGKLQTVDPCGEAYPKLCALLDNLSNEALTQLAAARIRFVSPLARNRIR